MRPSLARLYFMRDEPLSWLASVCQARPPRPGYLVRHMRIEQDEARVSLRLSNFSVLKAPAIITARLWLRAAASYVTLVYNRCEANSRRNYLVIYHAGSLDVGALGVSPSLGRRVKPGVCSRSGRCSGRNPLAELNVGCQRVSGRLRDGKPFCENNLIAMLFKTFCVSTGLCVSGD